MNKKKFLWIIPVLITLIVFTAFPAEAVTATKTANNVVEPKVTGQTVQVPLFTEPQVLKLPHNTTSYWFMIPSGTKLGSDCSVSLQIGITGTILHDYSNMTLLINNVPISSMRILDTIHNNEGVWTVPIPVERLKTDGTLNELRIVTAQRSILGDCADIDNPSNWVALKENSTLNLNVLQMGDPSLSTALPYFFNRIDQGNQANAEFVLPTNANPDTRASMLTVASAIGAQYPFKDNVQFAVSQGSSANVEPNRIYIGIGSQQPQGIATIPSLNTGNGYLAVAKNSGHYDLSLFGADAAGLSKAAAFFTNSTYLTQLSGSSAVISTDLRNKAKVITKKEDGYYALSDFGYDTVNLAGAFHQQANFVLKQPDTMRSGSDSYVEIHFRHSTALVADTSLLTVFVNDVAMNSVQLSDSNAVGGTIKAKIPASALEKSTVNIKVDCYNYLGKIDCSKDYYDTAWTVIDKNSTVYFEPGNSSLRPTLQQFPVFDLQTGNAVHTAVLSLPRSASRAMLETASELVFRAGQNTGDAYHWDYTNSLDTYADKASSDIMIMGDNDNVVIPDAVVKLLDVVPHGNNDFTIASSASVTKEALQNKIVVQVVRSPWNFARKVYVVTCPTSMESQLKQLVTNHVGLSTLSGYMALIDEKGTVTSITAASAETVDQVPLTFDRVIGQIVRFTGIPRVGLLIILACIVIIILLIIKSLRNRSRFANAKKKIETTNSVGGKYAAKAPSLPQKQQTPDTDNFDHNIDDR